MSLGPLVTLANLTPVQEGSKASNAIVPCEQ